MRTYELTVIYRIRENFYAEGVEATKEILKNRNFEIEKEEDMDERQLAYTIKKSNRGHYHFFLGKGDPSSVRDIENDLKLDPKILKYLFIVTE